MARLGSTSGATLVSDLTQSLNLALQSFGTPETREAQRLETESVQAEIDRQENIDKQLDILIPSGTGDPGATRPEEQAAILRLISLDPALGGAVRDTIAAGDEEAQEVLRVSAETGARNAAFIAKQPGFAAKQRAIGVLAEDAAARGEPLDKFIAMQNMNEDRLDLELQKQQIAARDIKTVLTPTERFEPVRNIQGDIVAQQSTATGRVIGDPRANTTGDSGKASAVTKIFQNGTTIQALPNGAVTVRGPGGESLEGEERLSALKAARDDDLLFEKTKAGAKAAGSAAINQATKSFEQLGKIKVSIANIDKAIDLLDQGASTGPIASKLPSIRAASVALDNVQKSMGLDVIGTTTFGALSKGELDLALSKALPTGLDEGALKEWLIEKRGAQEKLVRYIEDVTIFLGTPGNTVSDWVRIQKELRTGGGEDAGRLVFDSAGNLVQ